MLFWSLLPPNSVVLKIFLYHGYFTKKKIIAYNSITWIINVLIP